MVTGIYIPRDNTVPHHVRQFDGLSDYQAVVGGWVETVFIPSPPTTLLVNEEGKVRGLGRNIRATALWWVIDPLARHHDVLVGDVALVGSSRGRGTLTSLSDELVATLMSKRCVIESAKARVSAWTPHPRIFSTYFQAAVYALMMVDNDTQTHQDEMKVRIVAK